MHKFGLIWKEGRGDRSPQKQRERLEAEGVPKNAIDYDVPAPRSGEPILVDGIDFLGADPKGFGKDDTGHLAMWYAGKMSDGGFLRDIKTGKEYHGLIGLAELIVDWLTQRRRRQTAKGREARKKKKKRELPGFYERLTPTRQKELKTRFIVGEETVDDLARVFATSRESIYRVAKKLEWKRDK